MANVLHKKPTTEIRKVIVGLQTACGNDVVYLHVLPSVKLIAGGAQVHNPLRLADIGGVRSVL